MATKGIKLKVNELQLLSPKIIVNILLIFYYLFSQLFVLLNNYFSASASNQ